MDAPGTAQVLPRQNQKRSLHKHKSMAGLTSGLELLDPGVIAAAVRAAVVDKVEGRKSRLAAVVAQDELRAAGILHRQSLRGQK